jgi:hypothetical protein
MRRTRQTTKKIKIKDKVCKNCSKVLTIFEEAYLDNGLCFGCDVKENQQQKLF